MTEVRNFTWPGYILFHENTIKESFSKADQTANAQADLSFRWAHMQPCSIECVPV